MTHPNLSLLLNLEPWQLGPYLPVEKELCRTPSCDLRWSITDVGAMSGGTRGFGRFLSHAIATSVNDGIVRLKLQGSGPVLH